MSPSAAPLLKFGAALAVFSYGALLLACGAFAADQATPSPTPKSRKAGTSSPTPASKKTVASPAGKTSAVRASASPVRKAEEPSPAKSVATPAPAAAAVPSSGQPSLTPAEMPAYPVSEDAQRAAKRAAAAFAKADFATAKREYELTLKLAPDNPAASINLGLIEYRQHHYEQAETLLHRVVRTYPDIGLAWLILGIVYYEQEKLDAALAALAQAVLLEPNDARTHHFLGVTIGRKGWFSGAEDEMRRAIELQPDYAEAHFNLAVFYLQRNPPALELARRHYQKALDLGAAPDPQVAKLIDGS